MRDQRYTVNEHLTPPTLLRATTVESSDIQLLRASTAASRPITTETQSLEEETGNAAQTLTIGDAAVSLQLE
ncbi:hypothetical protein DPX16_5574 [Anabarilius grahami]|uniref:Uncharacterized protein n=1 Tax=Anabarilius grahami TaxID=495550 RepID=A0A3N0YAQ5_ANAGA|nr:hypothetical protein DPX16_5574 [Anabarilius grahami]